VDRYGYDKEKYGDLGVGHADELFLLFRNAMNQQGRTEEDQKVADHLMRMWLNFAKGQAPDDKWKRLEGPGEYYHVIDENAEIRLPMDRKESGLDMVWSTTNLARQYTRH